MVSVLYDRSYVGSQNDLEETEIYYARLLRYLLANRVLRFAVVAFARAKWITRDPFCTMSLKIE
jgi:hypothetical protein